jgi:hypothetical protein
MYQRLQRVYQIPGVQPRPCRGPPRVVTAVQAIPDTLSPFMVPDVQKEPVISLTVTSMERDLRVGFTGCDPQEPPGTGLKLNFLTSATIYGSGLFYCVFIKNSITFKVKNAIRQA